MACCTGQTNCNHIITIGYLKTFTSGLVQDGSGAAQDVDLSSLPQSARTDSYCPTYAQLTSGSLIPIYSDGGSHNWSRNVDGISINGNYDQSQCVKQEDLSVVYTRFELLSVTATPNTEISECGGNSVMSYTYTLRKYVKSMDGTCEVATTSTTENDTSDSGDAAIIYTSNETWATVVKPVVTLAKNGTHDSQARTATISGTIAFRGTQHQATATIGQKALSGDYKFWYHESELYSYDSVTVAPTHFSCDGGSWEATGYYTTHDWDIYRWEDSCGVVYDDDTRNLNDTYESHSEFASSGTAPFIDCGAIASSYTHTETIEYHGKTTSWTQECEKCGDCLCGETCRSETIHSGGTIPCTGGSVEIKYDYDVVQVTCNPSTGQRTETVIASGRNETYTTVYADGCNKTSSPITLPYGVVQEAGPCCPTSITYTFDDITVNCSAHSQTTSGLSWTSEKVEADGSITTDSGTYNKEIPSIECNPSNTSRLVQTRVTASTLDGARPLIMQEAGPCCCSCDSFGLTYSELSWDYNETNAKPNPFTAGTCIAASSVSAISSDNWFTVSVNSNNVMVTPSGQNATTSPKTATITVTYKNGDETCNGKTFTVIQNPYGCTCGDLVVASTPSDWAWNDTNAKTATYTLNTECITVQNVTSSDNWFSVSNSVVGGNGTITITPSGNNETSSAKIATITISYTSSGSSCSSAFTVTQKINGCDCTDLAVNNGTAPDTGYTTAGQVGTYVANEPCVTGLSASVAASASSWVTSLSLSNGIVYAVVALNDTGASREAVITVTAQMMNGMTCTKDLKVTQPSIPSCNCDDIEFTEA